MSVRAISRAVLVPLLCALFALAAIANARATGEKRANPAALTHFALCLPSGAAGDEPPPDHDCGACCLADVPTALVTPAALPLAYVRPDGPEPEWRGNAHANSSTFLPWARGPPARA